MNKKLLMFGIVLFISYCSFPQGIAIGAATPDSSAVLDVTHPSKGLLIPRMNITSILSVTNPARGLLIYDSLNNLLMVNTGNRVAPNWQAITPGYAGWELGGNNGINPANQFIGTIDNQPLLFRIN